MTINWLEPTTGNVSVALVSNVGGPTYTIVDSMPGTTHDCDAGGGVGVVVSGATCGSVDFIVPNDWENSANSASSFLHLVRMPPLLPLPVVPHLWLDS